MSDEFNPYHKWLGIPLGEQPADHYRLLGLVRFESDPDVITGASDQRMQFLHSLQNGDRGKMVDKLLNEIANAKVCLLNKEKKAAYDQKLRGKTASAKQTTQKPLFQADAESVSRRRVGNSKSARRNSKEENKPNRRPSGLIIGGGIVATLLLIGGFLLMSGQAKQKERERQAAIVEKQAVEKEKAEAQRQELKVARARAEAAERKLKEQAETAASRAQAQKESERRANKEAQRKAKQETARKAKEEAERRAKIESARQSRERASREVSSQKSAHQLLTARGLTLIQGTWRFFPLETEWFQLQSLSQVPPAQDHAWTAAFVEQYQRKMFNDGWGGTVLETSGLPIRCGFNRVSNPTVHLPLKPHEGGTGTDLDHLGGKAGANGWTKFFSQMKPHTIGHSVGAINAARKKLDAYQPDQK